MIVVVGSVEFTSLHRSVNLRFAVESLEHQMLSEGVAIRWKDQDISWFQIGVLQAQYTLRCTGTIHTVTTPATKVTTNTSTTIISTTATTSTSTTTTTAKQIM